MYTVGQRSDWKVGHYVAMLSQSTEMIVNNMNVLQDPSVTNTRLSFK